MTPHFMLPDSLAYILIASGVGAAVIAYIKMSIYDIKVFRRERAIREFKIAVEKNKTSQALAEHYMAAADGDPNDRDYWEETAKQFAGENR